MIKGIIFDLDGTILNTLLDMYECINKMLSDYDFKNKTIDDVRLGVGRGYRVLVENVLPKGSSEKLVDEALEKYKSYYSKGYNNKTKPYDGMVELMNILQEKGYLLAVNSNKGDDITKELININYPNIKFVDVIGSRKDIPNKPDPYSANEIIKKMGLLKEEVIYVGDSESDIQTGHNAHLKVVGCSYGFRDKQTLIENGADIIIDTPLDLLKVL